jgi:hypothetical protein
VLLGRYLPEIVRRVAEVAIGGIIVFLATRLLLRWQRGLYHAHTHSHDEGPIYSPNVGEGDFREVHIQNPA